MTFTFQNGDTLEMLRIQHSPLASQETYCFYAELFLNKKPFCQVSNDGRGGANHYTAIRNTTYTEIEELQKRCFDEMPKWSSPYDDEKHDMTLEIWCLENVNTFLINV